MLYMDNGATSFPKAPGVAERVYEYLAHVGSSINRGAYHASYEAENIVFETRERLCDLFAFDRPENVVFTKNITESLNVLIKGLFHGGDHVIVSSMEHNAVMRPLNSPALTGVTYSRAACDEEGNLDLAHLESLIGPRTKGVVMTHASNVCGTILDLKAVGRLCKARGLCFVVDAAQTAGAVPVKMDELHADALAFTGHKSLLGPQGIGGFLIGDSLVSQVRPLIEGGTGSASETEEQPAWLPDKYEGGTPNVPGIYGLHAALGFLKERGITAIEEEERELTQYFLEQLMNMGHLCLVGKKSTLGRTAVISVDFPDRDNGEMAYRLASEYGIMTRSGLHCAPSAHKTLGTFPQGTVRFGLSPFMDQAQIQYAVDCINKLKG